jgi:hypothetical protein
MSVNISTAFVQQYATNIAMLLQQQGSRLRGSVQENGFVGKAASVVEQFGSVSPVRNQSRHSDTPLISTPQDKRWIYPNDYDWADLIDQQDRLRMLIDPSGPYTQAGVMSMGRAIDDEIIAGFLGSNNSGENGTTAVGTLYAYNSNSQSVAATTGGSAACGLNIAKLRAAKKLLLQAEVDVDNDPLYIAISAQQNDNLLNEAQAISLDYNTKPVLVDGKISSFMGFNFIHSERIPGAANFNTSINSAITSSDADGSYVAGSRWILPCWAKSGVALGIWNDISASVDRRPDKRNSWQVYVTGTFGATRLEEKRCVLINCK